MGSESHVGLQPPLPTKATAGLQRIMAGCAPTLAMNTARFRASCSMPHFRWCARTDDMSSGDAGHESHHQARPSRSTSGPSPLLSCPADLDGLLRRSSPPHKPRLCDVPPVRLSRCIVFLTCANGHCNLPKRISIIEFVLLE